MNSNSNSPLSCPFPGPSWHASRECGLVWKGNRKRPRKSSFCPDFGQFLYPKMTPVDSMQPSTAAGAGHGGIFGLEFSPDGSILAAATENRCLLFLDPLQTPSKPVCTLHSVHNDCVNSIKYLDDRLFATCSDDHMVKLWDMRFLRQNEPVRTFRGHSNWVKNIEFVPEKGMLVTSAFDNMVLGWDINNFSAEPKRLFYTPGLMRMRLTPDGSKMLLSTQWGYIFVIHHLDLDTVSNDLFGFKPNTAWISIHTNALFPVQPEHINQFSANRNRAELIVDFPPNCDPDHISSLTPHPQGWCVASRANHSDERSEWTCIHDIQLPPAPPAPSGKSVHDDSTPTEVELPTEDRTERIDMPNEVTTPTTNAGTVSNVITIQMDGSSSDDTQSSEEEHEPTIADAENYERSLGVSRMRRRRMRVLHRRSVQVDVANPNTNNNQNASASRLFMSGSESGNQHTFLIRSGARSNANRTILILDTRNRRHQNELSPPPAQPMLQTIEPEHQHALDTVPTHKRLLYFQQEPRVGRGFIKEVSWSPEGRVLASPFAFGVRILAFDPNCPELSDTVSSKFQLPPKQLYQVATCIGHKNVVLSAKFSLSHCLLATGCMSGQIVFQQPFN